MQKYFEILIFINGQHFKFRIFFIIFFIKVNMCLTLHQQASFWLLYDMYCRIYSPYHLLNIHIFSYWSHIFVSFIIDGFNKSLGNNGFSFVICWIHTFIIILQPWFHWSFVKFTFFVYPFFIFFAIKLIYNFFEKN